MNTESVFIITHLYYMFIVQLYYYYYMFIVFRYCIYVNNLIYKQTILIICTSFCSVCTVRLFTLLLDVICLSVCVCVSI